MRQRVTRGLILFWSCIGVFLMFQSAGCGKSASSSAPPDPPAGSGEALYRIKAPDKTMIALERGKKRAEVPVPPEYKLFDQDVIENKGTKPAIMNELQKGHTFTLAPGSKVKIGSNSIVMYLGSTIFEFEKVHGEFRIVLPKATLGIKGTRFEVTVQETGNASVRLFEGSIAIECQGRTTTLENQATALIDDSPTPVKITPASGTLPANTGTGEEDIQRNRVSPY